MVASWADGRAGELDAAGLVIADAHIVDRALVREERRPVVLRHPGPELPGAAIVLGLEQRRVPLPLPPRHTVGDEEVRPALGGGAVVEEVGGDEQVAAGRGADDGGRPEVEAGAEALRARDGACGRAAGQRALGAVGEGRRPSHLRQPKGGVGDGARGAERGLDEQQPQGQRRSHLAPGWTHLRAALAGTHLDQAERLEGM